jgi:hypothetical protein
MNKARPPGIPRLPNAERNGMKKKTLSQTVEDFRGLIVHVRGVPVILDSDLARVYGVTTGALNQAVKRNRERFPDEFVFLVDPQEVTILKSQFVISSCPSMRSHFVTASDTGILSQFVTASGHGGRRSGIQAFTEHGAIMASMVLNSPQAVKTSVFVVKAFVAMRAMFTGQHDLAKKLADLERTLAERLDTHEHAISDIIQQLMHLLSPPPEIEYPPPRPIGFAAHERRASYRTRKKARAGDAPKSGTD